MTVDPNLRSSAAKKWVWRFAIVFAIVWTLVSFSGNFSTHGFNSFFHGLSHRLPVLFLSFIVFEICFNVGLVMMGVGVRQKIRQDGGNLRSLIALRSRLRELISSDSTNIWFKWGLILNLIGAVATTGVIPIVAVIWLCEPIKWPGLIILPCLDIVASILLRIKLRPRHLAKIIPIESRFQNDDDPTRLLKEGS